MDTDPESSHRALQKTDWAGPAVRPSKGAISDQTRLSKGRLSTFVDLHGLGALECVLQLYVLPVAWPYREATVNFSGPLD